MTKAKKEKAVVQKRSFWERNEASNGILLKDDVVAKFGISRGSKACQRNKAYVQLLYSIDAFRCRV